MSKVSSTRVKAVDSIEMNMGRQRFVNNHDSKSIPSSSDPECVPPSGHVEEIANTYEKKCEEDDDDKPAVQTSLRKGNQSAQVSLSVLLDTELSGIKEAGTWKAERIITSKQAAEINVLGYDSKILNFCSNNYLGLLNHPEVIAAVKASLDTHGAGLSSTRYISGTQDIHKELERKVAKFHDREDAILYSSCYDANTGFFEVLLNDQDAVISDALNHASIIDGIRLCKSKKYRYAHGNMIELESQLKESQGCRMRLIVTEGVFGMDGTVAKLREICDLAEKYNALVFMDECHATGFFGHTGRGTEEHCGIMGRVHFINSSLGKALGGASGGYTTGSKQIVDLLRQRSRPYLFSTTVAPPLVAIANKVFEILSKNSDLPEKVKRNTHRFRERMTKAGFTLINM
ncbi:unnamed protein product [Owenia fusiformis]|uniref:Aminotransferase class I/classII large domain-containing protein n=1 Tax=Owenia fusiformis TaxID=6347 RepID=A0A8S4P3Q0_OWEFU|nr:unnamed protein product [Owenia fusiformis]